MIKPKSINALMAHMRSKGISIKGSTQKRKLRYMGYFHGYKGYRYCQIPTSSLNYTDFNELQAVYDFDMQLKSLLYPKVMFIETTIKNYVLECILETAGSSRFADIHSKVLTDYKSHQIGTSKYKDAIKDRMGVRNKIYSEISSGYERHIVKHYYNKDRPVPIWAIFELLSLGDFARFLKCIEPQTRIKISKAIGFKSSVDADGTMTAKLVFTIRDLRNAIAHNNIIFDSRFKTGNVNKRLSTYLSNETLINNITFDTIVDYIILIAFLMKMLRCNKTEILTFIQQFQTYCEILRKVIPISEYSKINHTDTRTKLQQLKNCL